MIFTYRYPLGIREGSGWLHLEPHFTLQAETFFAHTHEFMEITLISEGKGRHRCAGKGHDTMAGDIIVCPPGLAHQYVDSSGQSHRNIHFDPSLLNDLKAHVDDLKTLDDLFPSKGMPARVLRLSSKELISAELALREIEAEQGDAKPGKSAAIRLLFQKFLLGLARIATNREQARGEGKRPISSGLFTARQLMRQNSQDPHTLDSLARVASMSAPHFRRMFRQSYGESPIQLLIRDRVRSACGPLESGEQSVTEIAFECGFKDSNYFTRQFSKIMGATPTAYRAMFRKPV